MPIFLRACRSSLAESAVISFPSTVTEPEVGRSSRLMHRTSVDLPAPEKPMMPKISPLPIERLTSCTACTVRPPEAKFLEICVSSIKTIPVTQKSGEPTAPRFRTIHDPERCAASNKTASVRSRIRSGRQQMSILRHRHTHTARHSFVPNKHAFLLLSVNLLFLLVI